MDQLDRDLLRILQKDAKTPFTKIAKELRQPDTTIHFRAKRLKDNNIVTRYCALVCPEALGYTVSALLRIEIGGHILPDISKGRAQTFAEELSKEEHYLWVAVEDEPMVVHALMMGVDEKDLRMKTETLRKSPDVLNVTYTSINSIAKGWEMSGNPE
ncbi:MAG: Lrp/AsnC family transcriptional regulator [Promethearchaeota archaeon]